LMAHPSIQLIFSTSAVRRLCHFFHTASTARRGGSHTCITILPVAEQRKTSELGEERATMARRLLLLALLDGVTNRQKIG